MLTVNMLCRLGGRVAGVSGFRDVLTRYVKMSKALSVTAWRCDGLTQRARYYVTLAPMRPGIPHYATSHSTLSPSKAFPTTPLAILLFSPPFPYCALAPSNEVPYEVPYGVLFRRLGPFKAVPLCALVALLPLALTNCPNRSLFAHSLPMPAHRLPGILICWQGHSPGFLTNGAIGACRRLLPPVKWG